MWHARLGAALQHCFGPDRVGEWMQRAVPITADEDLLLLAVPDVTARNRWGTAVRAAITQRLRQSSNRNVAVRVVVDPACFPLLVTPQPEKRRIPTHTNGSGRGTTRPGHALEGLLSDPSNSKALRAASRFLESGGLRYPFLVFHGPPGSGRTAILRALRDGLVRNGIDARLVSVVDFSRQYRHALREGRPDPFRRRFRTLDVLLLDDLKALDGKPHTAMELRHTLDALQARGGRVVLACDVPPHRMDFLDRALRSRLARGLELPLTPPDEDLRRRTLAAYLAGSGRSWPAAVLRSLAAAKLGFQDMLNAAERLGRRDTPSQADVEDILSSTLPSNRTEETMDRVARIVAERLQVRRADIFSRCRRREVSEARRICFFLSRETGIASTRRIGEFFGGRSHATVTVACRYVADNLSDDAALRRQVREIETELAALALCAAPHRPSGEGPGTHDIGTPRSASRPARG